MRLNATNVNSRGACAAPKKKPPGASMFGSVAERMDRDS
jgi:hypothetical protein